jgi:hypothetical protein
MQKIHNQSGNWLGKILGKTFGRLGMEGSAWRMVLSKFSTGRESAGFSRLIRSISPGSKLQKLYRQWLFSVFPSSPNPYY